MPERRKDHPSGHRHRSERCVVVDGAWFVTTREGVDVGPYSTKAEAERGAQELENILSILDGLDDSEMAQAFIREFARRQAPSA